MERVERGMSRRGAQGHEAKGCSEEPATRVDHPLTLRRRWVDVKAGGWPA